jgi:hypothetical protein
MRMTLAGIADDGDLLRLDQTEIGILIVIDAHESSFEKCRAAIWQG